MSQYTEAKQKINNNNLGFINQNSGEKTDAGNRNRSGSKSADMNQWQD